MGLWDFLTGGTGSAAKGAAEGALSGVGDLAVKLRTAFTGDIPPEVKVHLAEIEAEIAKGQMAINVAEAQNGNLFVSGWRPALGWVCVGALALYYPARIILGMYFWCVTAWGLQTLPPMPEMGISDILGLVATLLGSATLRTYEKTQDVHGEH